MSKPDAVDAIEAAWDRERPDLDAGSIGIVTRIWRIGRHLERSRSALLARHGTDSSTLDLLGTLRRSGAPYKLTPTDIAHKTLLTTGRISQRLAKAEAEGLVIREISKSDSRSIVVTLTSAGFDLVEQVVSELLPAEKALLDELSDSEQQHLTATLRRLLGSLDNSATTPTA